MIQSPPSRDSEAIHNRRQTSWGDNREYGSVERVTERVPDPSTLLIPSEVVSKVDAGDASGSSASKQTRSIPFRPKRTERDYRLGRRCLSKSPREHLPARIPYQNDCRQPRRSRAAEQTHNQ